MQNINIRFVYIIFSTASCSRCDCSWKQVFLKLVMVQFCFLNFESTFKETPQQVLSCEPCENFKKAFLIEHLRMTASGTAQ